MSRLIIAVPKGRAFCGRAVLVAEDGTVRAGPFRALATASVRVAAHHGNPDATPMLPFGHPPTGTYVVAASLPPRYLHKKRSRRYGRAGGLLLAPQSGDALAAVANGRKLIAMHGGPRDEKRRLRPTRGGIRLSNRDMRRLLLAINDAQLGGDGVALVQLAEVDMTDMTEASKRDKKGGHSLAPRRTRRSVVAPMLLLPFALGAGGRKAIRRRDVLLAATAAFGALAVQSCDRPSLGGPPLTWWCYPEDSGIDDATENDAGQWLGPDGAVIDPSPFDAGCPTGWAGHPIRGGPAYGGYGGHAVGHGGHGGYAGGGGFG